MGLFADVFGYTPDEYRALTVADFGVLLEYLKEREAAAKKRA
jgi:hypothetical protein